MLDNILKEDEETRGRRDLVLLKDNENTLD